MDRIAITLPWAVLAADNHRLTPSRGRLVKSSEYRKRMAIASLMLRGLWREPIIRGPVRLHARLHFPDRRKRDAGNYRKFLTDCLSGIAYVDDSDVWSETWERAGIDRENPRVELHIAPLEPAA